MAANTIGGAVGVAQLALAALRAEVLVCVFANGHFEIEGASAYGEGSVRVGRGAE